MAQSKAATVDAYLDELSPERRTVMATVRDVVRRNLPQGYRESMAFGMIGWGVPLERYPNMYNKQPLAYVALAAQKNYYALYLMQPYMDPTAEVRLRDAFAAAGKKMDMGKSCLRFKRAEDLPLDAIGAMIAETPPERLIAQYEAARAR